MDTKFINKEIEFLTDVREEIDRRYGPLSSIRVQVPEELIKEVAKLRVELLRVEDLMYKSNRYVAQSKCEHTFVQMTNAEVVDGTSVPEEYMCTKCYYVRTV